MADPDRVISLGVLCVLGGRLPSEKPKERSLGVGTEPIERISIHETWFDSFCFLGAFPKVSRFSSLLKCHAASPSCWVDLPLTDMTSPTRKGRWQRRRLSVEATASHRSASKSNHSRLAFKVPSAMTWSSNFPTEIHRGEPFGPSAQFSFRISFRRASLPGSRRSSIVAWLISATMIWPTSWATSVKSPWSRIFPAWYWLSSVGET